MAEDDSYYNSRVKDIDGAVSMSKQINGQFGFDSAYGKENGTQIAQIGIRLNDDGTTTYFVELEKLSEKQKERIENAKEKKAADAKKADKSAEKAQTVKKHPCRQIPWKSCRKRSGISTGTASKRRYYRPRVENLISVHRNRSGEYRQETQKEADTRKENFVCSFFFAGY